MKKVTKSIRTVLKQLCRPYKENLISWRETKLLENYISNRSLPKSIRIGIVPANRPITPQLMQKWEQKATSCSLWFLNRINKICNPRVKNYRKTKTNIGITHKWKKLHKDANTVNNLSSSFEPGQEGLSVLLTSHIQVCEWVRDINFFFLARPWDGENSSR